MALKKALFSSFALVAGASALCYRPNGTVTDDPGLRMCGAVQYSNCCYDWEECTPNGYCLGGGNYYREYCTDPTWQTDKCGNLCLDVKDGFTLGTILTLCDDGSFCCGYNNQDCCKAGLGQKIDAKGQVIRTSSTSTSTSTTSRSSTKPSTTTTSSTTSPTQADTKITAEGTTPTSTDAAANSESQKSNTQSRSSGLSTGAKAGIGAGIAVVGLALCGFAFLYFRERRRRKELANEARPQVPGDQPHEYHGGMDDGPQVRTPSMVDPRYVIDPRTAPMKYDLPSPPPVEKYGYVSTGRNMSELPAGRQN